MCLNSIILIIYLVLDVSREFADWDPQKQEIKHVLAFVKKIFYQIDGYINAPPLNVDAHQLYITNKQGFILRASNCVEESVENIYVNREDSSMQFSPWSKELEAVSDTIFKKDQPSLRGMFSSWVSGGVSRVSKIISIKY